MGTGIELLEPERVVALWPVLSPMLEPAVAANEIAQVDISVADIFRLTQTDRAFAFLCSKDGVPELCLVMQFSETGDRKGADIIAMGGKRMALYNRLYMEPVKEWLKANGATYLDAYTSPRLARILRSRMGFGRQCVMSRMEL